MLSTAWVQRPIQKRDAKKWPWSGILHMAGFFPSVPTQVNFELAYAPVGGRWRLFALSVSFGQAAPAAPQPPPSAPQAAASAAPHPPAAPAKTNPAPKP
ncbi:MAG TPA: hypothetical protein VM910_30960 [Bradyrhizobium sp.]|jgi:hypothetical protein|nr:hypothetical protein [Bradyrhizobium sp.]